MYVIIFISNLEFVCGLYSLSAINLLKIIIVVLFHSNDWL